MTGMLGALAAVAKAGCIFSRLCGQAKAGRRNDKPKVADRARDGLGYLNQFERHDRIINFPVWQTRHLFWARAARFHHQDYATVALVARSGRAP
jgi:hypothetical protein